MDQDRSGKITVPVDFNNKNRLVALTFYIMDDGTFFFKVGKKTIALSDSGQVANIINDMGAKAMEALTELMDNAKVGTAFTLITQIREQPHAVIPGLGFIDQEVSGSYYQGQGYWERLLNNWFMLLNIESSTQRRYKPNKEGFLNLQRDIESNSINVDKDVVQSMFNNPFSNAQSPFVVEPEEEEEDNKPQGSGTVKASHPEKNRTNLS